MCRGCARSRTAVAKARAVTESSNAAPRLARRAGGAIRQCLVPGVDERGTLPVEPGKGRGRLLTAAVLLQGTEARPAPFASAWFQVYRSAGMVPVTEAKIAVQFPCGPQPLGCREPAPITGTAGRADTIESEGPQGREMKRVLVG